jgi:inosine-uridine nucleoside N-ribohydrolase
MSLIIETDIGHDPDDLFAICYLAAAGADILAICVTPGDPDQIAIARFACERLGLDIPIGAAKLGREKLSSGSIHHALLKRYGKDLCAEADGLGHDIIASTVQHGSELFVIGPVTSVGTYLSIHRHQRCPFTRATMQGGFVPYSLYRPPVTLPKFEGRGHMPTFNLNGDVGNAYYFLSAPMARQMVGKNVCHTMLFDAARFARFTKPTCAAAELFAEAATLLLADGRTKAFHDPTAAVCHLHPEVGTWIDGKTIRCKDGWTTVPGEDKVLVDIDRDALWGRLETWS